MIAVPIPTMPTKDVVVLAVHQHLAKAPASMWRLGHMVEPIGTAAKVVHRWPLPLSMAARPADPVGDSISHGTSATRLECFSITSSM